MKLTQNQFNDVYCSMNRLLFEVEYINWKYTQNIQIEYSNLVNGKIMTRGITFHNLLTLL